MTQVRIFSQASSREALMQALASPDSPLITSEPRSDQTYRFVYVGDDPQAMINAQASTEAPKVLALFTGQGAQFPGMGQVLYQQSALFKQWVDQGIEQVSDFYQVDFKEILFASEDDLRIHQTQYTQPALFIIEYALAKLWQSLGIVFDYALGHSIGEITALTVANVMTFTEGLYLVCQRARAMQYAPSGGAMVAVMCGAEQAASLLQEHPSLDIAAYNQPQQTVFSGESAAIEALIITLKAQNIRHRQLEVSHAFHSVMMEGILPGFAKQIEHMVFKTPDFPVISNVTAEPLLALDAHYLQQQIRSPVHFQQGIAYALAENVNVVVEIGPQAVLSAMAKRCAPEASWLKLSSMSKKQQDDAFFYGQVSAFYQQHTLP